jgi:hypothetical protein
MSNDKVQILNESEGIQNSGIQNCSLILKFFPMKMFLSRSEGIRGKSSSK